MEAYFGAKLAYNSYRLRTRGIAPISGAKLPDFEDLTLSVQDAWTKAVVAMEIEEVRSVLVACRARFKTIQETNPELDLDDDIQRITLFLEGGLK